MLLGRRNGHEDAVNCITLSTDQDLCVSSALEGTLLFHTLSQGRCRPLSLADRQVGLSCIRQSKVQLSCALCKSPAESD